MTAMSHYSVEVTDTFGGQANYCWLRKYKISVPRPATPSTSDYAIYTRRIKRAAKAAAGMTGTRGNWCDYGDTMEFRPAKACIVMFVTYDDTQGEN